MSGWVASRCSAYARAVAVVSLPRQLQRCGAAPEDPLTVGVDRGPQQLHVAIQRPAEDHLRRDVECGRGHLGVRIHGGVTLGCLSEARDGGLSGPVLRRGELRQPVWREERLDDPFLVEPLRGVRGEEATADQPAHLVEDVALLGEGLAVGEHEVAQRGVHDRMHQQAAADRADAQAYDVAVLGLRPRAGAQGVTAQLQSRSEQPVGARSPQARRW